MGGRTKNITPQYCSVGRTEDGASVIAGDFVFFLIEARGIHLGDLLETLREKNEVVDWIGFIEESQKRASWPRRAVLRHCKEALTDVYGRDHFDEWYDRFKMIWPESVNRPRKIKVEPHEE